METWEETVMKLNADKLSMQKELERTHVERKQSALELQGVREQMRKAQERITQLVKAVNFMRREAQIVSFTEYGKVKAILSDNRLLIDQYQSQAHSATEKGVTASQRAQDLTKELEHIDTELSTHGKVIPFPVPFQGFTTPYDEEEAPDDDD